MAVLVAKASSSAMTVVQSDLPDSWVNHGAWTRGGGESSPGVVAGVSVGGTGGVSAGARATDWWITGVYSYAAWSAV